MFQGSAAGSASRSASGSASGVPHIPLPFRWWTLQKCIHPFRYADADVDVDVLSTSWGKTTCL